MVRPPGHGAQPNLHAALTWCFSEGDAASGTAIAASSWWYWLLRDRIREGHTWLTQAVSSRAGDERSRAAALLGVGWMCIVHPDIEMPDGLAPLAESRALWHELGDPGWEAYCLITTAQIELFANSSVERAGDILREASALTEPLRDPWMHCYTEVGFGLLNQVQGNKAAAQARYEAGLALGRASGDRLANVEALRALARDSDAPLGQRIAWAQEGIAAAREIGFPRQTQLLLENLASLYASAGRFDDAKRTYEESNAIVREQGMSSHTHVFLLGRGQVALQEGNLVEAETWYRKGIEAASTDRCNEHQWIGLVGLAQTFACQERFGRAITCFSAAERLCEEAWRLGTSDKARYDASVAAARVTLNEEAWAEAWSKGQTLSLEKAVAFALAIEGA